MILAVQTIIAPNGIDRLAFRMDTESVLCEVGAEALYITKRNVLDRITAQAVSRRTLTTEDQVWFQSKARRICGGRSGSGKGGFWVFRLYSVSIIPPVLHTHSCITDILLS